MPLIVLTFLSFAHKLFYKSYETVYVAFCIRTEIVEIDSEQPCEECDTKRETISNNAKVNIVRIPDIFVISLRVSQGILWDRRIYAVGVLCISFHFIFST